MSQSIRRKCFHCRELFLPHPAVGHRQKYCSTRSCQKARKAKNNREFLKRNPDYHRGRIAVARTQNWRSKNPGYWRRMKRAPKLTHLEPDALQAELDGEHPDIQQVTEQELIAALQAELMAQRSIFQGFVSQVTGCVPPACGTELGPMLSQWHDKGVAIGAVQCSAYRAQSPLNKGDFNDEKQQPCSLCRANSTGAETIQLG